MSAAVTGDDSVRPTRRRRLRTLRAVGVALTVGVAAGFAAPASPAQAAGVTTHGWMAVSAIDHVTDPALAALLRAHEDQVRAGGMFPDVGYFSTNTYGEEAHWQRFIDTYLDLIAERPDCGADLADPDGPCAPLIAHAFGVAAHGMGDEVWDWLFEPNGPDRNEYYVNGLPTANEGGAETQMDLVAVAVHGVPRPVIPPLPDQALLLEAFEQSGMTGVTAAQFDFVPMLPYVWDLETGWAVDHLAGVQASMPWMSANMVTAPGGVNFAARSIAGYWSSMWGRLNGAQPATRVSVTYPASGQDDIPATRWVRSYQPGSSRGRGGARTRITAVLTYSRPYAPPTGGPGVPAQMAPGTMTVTDVASGEVLPILSGFPRSAPYGGDAGQHLIDVQPARDLDACHWYEVGVGVTTPVLDARGQAVTPYRWRFRTACGPEDHAVTGTVRGPSGRPVGNALVLAYPVGDDTPAASAVTGPDGRYTITDLAPGQYRILVIPPADSNLAQAWLTASTGPVTVPNPNLVVDGTLVTSYPVSGRVTDYRRQGRRGVEVLAFATGNLSEPVARTVTDQFGNYRLTNLPPGTYLIAARPSPQAPLRWYSRLGRPGPTLRVGPAPIVGINFTI